MSKSCKHDDHTAAPVSLISSSEQATLYLGHCLAGLLVPGSVLSLDGDLGAGKTTLVRGLARGLGCRERITSPTFTLLIEHKTASEMPLYHFDAYRLAGSEAFIDAGLDEFFEQEGISVVEWGSLIADILPGRTIFITLCRQESGQPDQRLIRITAPAQPALIRQIRQITGSEEKETGLCLF